MSVGRCFEDRLNWSLLSSSNSLLRHIRSRKDNDLRQNLHNCPGYLREEIALTCDLSKSAIVSHAFPGPSERCSICHQLVQYTYSDSFDSNNIYYPPTTPNNSLSLPPTEEALDREPIQAYRTPSAPMSRRAAAAAASVTIANMVASENGTAYMPQTMPSATTIRTYQTPAIGFPKLDPASPSAPDTVRTANPRGRGPYTRVACDACARK